MVSTVVHDSIGQIETPGSEAWQHGMDGWVSNPSGFFQGIQSTRTIEQDNGRDDVGKQIGPHDDIAFLGLN